MKVYLPPATDYEMDDANWGIGPPKLNVQSPIFKKDGIG